MSSDNKTKYFSKLLICWLKVILFCRSWSGHYFDIYCCKRIATGLIYYIKVEFNNIIHFLFDKSKTPNQELRVENPNTFLCIVTLKLSYNERKLLITTTLLLDNLGTIINITLSNTPNLLCNSTQTLCCNHQWKFSDEIENSPVDNSHITKIEDYISKNLIE